MKFNEMTYTRPDIDALLARDFGHAVRRGASHSPAVPILVPESDRREAVTASTAQDDFMEV